MRKARILAYCLNLMSISAAAHYECELKLAHSEDLYTTIATKKVEVKKAVMNAGNMGVLFVESESKRRQTTLEINGVMSGWENEEDASFVIIRREKRKYSSKFQRLTDQVLTVKGNDKITGWFDSYKIDIDCKTK
jgi:hypothetical protein